ncbi:MAG: hypothetical protein EHM58_14765 [Ignavibacteriae bacterium]|nr:MAG: hypothetical protein EHM58_14765 [Ignavibacteriota bacterium]
MKSFEEKYWITPDGELIKLEDYNIREHFKFFNSSKRGISFKKEFGFDKIIMPKDMGLILSKGFIRILVIGEIINISYAAESSSNCIPVSPKAVKELLAFISKKNNIINEVQYDVFIETKTFSKICSLNDFLDFFE